MEKTRAHPPAGERIHPLTSLRFFAALFVVLFHTVVVFFPTVTPERGLGRFLSFGYISVSFFFFLSGYILAFVYLGRGKDVLPRTFYRARFARVYPLLLLTLVLDTPFLVLEELHKYGSQAALLKSGVVFAGSAILLQAWTNKLAAINNPSWSLSVEAIFYLLFPLLGHTLWKLRGVGLWLTSAALYFGGLAVVLLASHHVPIDLCRRLPLLHLSTFVLGILLARGQELYRASGKVTKISGAWEIAVFCACIVCFAALVWLSPRSVLIDDFLHDGLLVPLFAGIIWVFSSSAFAPGQLLGAPWVVVLGEASFGLYLFHVPMLHLFSSLGRNRGPVAFTAHLSASIAVSVLSFYVFETPVRRWILKSQRPPIVESMELASDAQ
jgi:peptidoglycan/LPS O-acetylase OafA/YrhL